MKELLKTIVTALVENPDKITVEEDTSSEDGVILYTLKVAESDMGRVIGKQGRIAKAIRKIMRATANKQGKLVQVNII